MVIIPNILGEVELRHFNSDDWGTLNSIISTYIAKVLLDYVNNPKADQEIVNNINKYCGKRIYGIANNEYFRREDVRGVLNGLYSQDVSKLNKEQYAEIDKTLKEIDNRLGACLTEIEPRTKESYESFRSMMVHVVARVQYEGETPTCGNRPILDIIKDNSEIFYSRKEKLITLPAKGIKNYRNTWYSTNRGIDWNSYCTQNNIPYEKRGYI